MTDNRKEDVRCVAVFLTDADVDADAAGAVETDAAGVVDVAGDADAAVDLDADAAGAVEASVRFHINGTIVFYGSGDVDASRPVHKLRPI